MGEGKSADDGQLTWTVEQADCLGFLRGRPPSSCDLIFGSPPYELARLYLEDGEPTGAARPTEEWVAWMVEVFKESLRVCRGLVAFVVEGQTKDYRYSGGPALLWADLIRAGICTRKAPIFQRVGIPGSGGPDWWRNDYEFVLCATRGGRLPWSDNTAVGRPPKWHLGGEMSNRTVNGSRANARPGRGAARALPQKANPGNVAEQQVYTAAEVAALVGGESDVLRCIVGGGLMGSELAHQNEAPFPEELAERFVRSFCPEGGLVIDCFSGSGTTAAVCRKWGRSFVGCDLRRSQVELTRRRIEEKRSLLDNL